MSSYVWPEKEKVVEQGHENLGHFFTQITYASVKL